MVDACLDPLCVFSLSSSQLSVILPRALLLFPRPLLWGGEREGSGRGLREEEQEKKVLREAAKERKGGS
jgi:hypothetical protein